MISEVKKLIRISAIILNILIFNLAWRKINDQAYCHVQINRKDFQKYGTRYKFTPKFGRIN